MLPWHMEGGDCSGTRPNDGDAIKVDHRARKLVVTADICD
jgi:hypothetical protein